MRLSSTTQKVLNAFGHSHNPAVDGGLSALASAFRVATEELIPALHREQLSSDDEIEKAEVAMSKYYYRQLNIIVSEIETYNQNKSNRNHL